MAIPPSTKLLGILAINVMKKHLENRPVYVQLENPSSTRKNVLESAIIAVELLEKYEYTKEIKALKREKMKLAKKIVYDLNLELSALTKALPQAYISKKEKRMVNNESRESQGKKPVSLPEQSKQKKKKPNSELKRLESELYEIKNKLSGLDM
ncbi:MAG TPA: hypothetical protein VJJ21_02180 [Candidatus Nanoarchaeia archaeon]|nr:hypothetical protein [Candidatus Nanoarchaeia archaeon]